MSETVPPPPPITSATIPERPQEVENLRIFFIVAAIVNGVITVVWLISVVVGGLASCGIGCQERSRITREMRFSRRTTCRPSSLKKKKASRAIQKTTIVVQAVPPIL